ncbi:aminoglycoside phosphotransferase family protein [Deinococcus sp. Marseille-Q6407]|uniref:aminoglycoside phosphotransferase family protein n=1 Tax=Deinococcus sp. Marseille-Q6407 TaxID=2969223 RepID=UPI0028FC0AC2|nr:aminoglycoside phosphotransferase family protein [Deinococcus sp. Marseille-Q6407]
MPKSWSFHLSWSGACWQLKLRSGLCCRCAALLPMELIMRYFVWVISWRSGCRVSAGQQKMLRRNGEWRWLPQLAPQLPVPVSVPIFCGVAAEEYPWNWSICPWLPGKHPQAGQSSHPQGLTSDLAGFFQALHRQPAPAEAPAAGRGGPVRLRDEDVREVIQELGARVNGRAVLRAWDAVMESPDWSGPPVWIHGDPLGGNLLTQAGRLSAVIDFGGLGVGDPAADFLGAWQLFTPFQRRSYRQLSGVDEATWQRARGWALSVALFALPYYWDTAPSIRERSQQMIAQVLLD